MKTMRRDEMVNLRGTHMHQIVAKVGDVYYTGRGFGASCIFKGKRKAKQCW